MSNFVPKPGRLMDLGFGILRRSTDYILIVEVCEVMRFHHYSLSTEKSYAQWILRYIRFNNRQHLKVMGKPEIERFLRSPGDEPGCFRIDSKPGTECHFIPIQGSFKVAD